MTSKARDIISGHVGLEPVIDINFKVPRTDSTLVEVTDMFKNYINYTHALDCSYKYGAMGGRNAFQDKILTLIIFADSTRVWGGICLESCNCS